MAGTCTCRWCAWVSNTGNLHQAHMFQIVQGLTMLFHPPSLPGFWLMWRMHFRKRSMWPRMLGALDLVDPKLKGSCLTWLLLCVLLTFMSTVVLLACTRYLPYQCDKACLIWCEFSMLLLVWKTLAVQSKTWKKRLTVKSGNFVVLRLTVDITYFHFLIISRCASRYFLYGFSFVVSAGEDVIYVTFKLLFWRFLFNFIDISPGEATFQTSNPCCK